MPPCPAFAKRGSIQSKWIKCGKAGCKKCPHGPYYYVSSKWCGKTRWEYLGRTLRDVLYSLATVDNLAEPGMICMQTEAEMSYHLGGVHSPLTEELRKYLMNLTAEESRSLGESDAAELATLFDTYKHQSMHTPVPS